MKKYTGLGKEDMDFETAMDLIRQNIEREEEYVMDLLFDILMEAEDEPITNTIHYWS